MLNLACESISKFKRKIELEHTIVLVGLLTHMRDVMDSEITIHS